MRIFGEREGTRGLRAETRIGVAAVLRVVLRLAALAAVRDVVGRYTDTRIAVAVSIRALVRGFASGWRSPGGICA